jgi:type VI secretion system protein ImpF
MSSAPRSIREAVQPSLWDRLVNDLPGLAAEIAAERAGLARELGAERVDALLSGGARAIAADFTVTEEEKRRLNHLLLQERRRDELEARGIVVSPQVLREAVRRDVEALFNTERFEARPLLTEQEATLLPDDPPALDDFPEVRRSVVNYGVPAFAGRTSRDFDRDALTREIKGILAIFEPRLKPQATRVTVGFGGKDGGLSIEIDGLLMMAPAPERLRLRTMIDLDSGQARTEARG